MYCNTVSVCNGPISWQTMISIMQDQGDVWNTARPSSKLIKCLTVSIGVATGVSTGSNVVCSGRAPSLIRENEQQF